MQRQESDTSIVRSHIQSNHRITFWHRHPICHFCAKQTPAFSHSVIYSFARLFIRLFVRLVVHSFNTIHSFNPQNMKHAQIDIHIHKQFIFQSLLLLFRVVSCDFHFGVDHAQAVRVRLADQPTATSWLRRLEAWVVHLYRPHRFERICFLKLQILFISIEFVDAIVQYRIDV